MQRRPIIVIFTLEDDTGQVLGRRVLSVKICSNTKREMDREETHTPIMNPNDIIDNFFFMPMENGSVVDLDLLQTPEKVQENRETSAVGFVNSSPTGILLCQSELGGSANFEVLFDSSSQSKRQKWIYSDTLQKVFIDINKVLLLNFKFDYDKIDSNMSLFVRAMPMYNLGDWLKEPVNRCLLHLSPIDKLNKDFTHLEHVIRCDNENTDYQIDQVSRRKSVVTLLSRPEHGLDKTRLSYRFVCKTSCIGGMQRRPIIVIFTLEDDTGQVLGRRVLPVKICSNPKREMDREETYTHSQKNTVHWLNKKCIPQEINHNNNRHHHSDSDSTNTFSLFYTTKKKENYKIVLESIYSVIAGASSLHDITDTQPLLTDLKSRLKNLN